MSWIEYSLLVKTDDYTPYESCMLSFCESVVVDDPKASIRAIEKGQWEAHGFSLETLKHQAVKLTCYLKKSEEMTRLELSESLEKLAKEKGDAISTQWQALHEVDWANEWKKNYELLQFGEKIELVPIWLEPTGTREIVIKVNPGLAFGTGHHDTTALPLSLMEGYIDDTKTVYDIGTGSGILAICAKKLGAKEVIGYDYDAIAVRTAKEQAKLNDENIAFYESDLFDRVSGKADLIIANIVTKILKQLVPDLARYLTKDGKAILSGISLDTLEEMMRVLKDYHFRIIEKKASDEWVALVVERID